MQSVYTFVLMEEKSTIRKLIDLPKSTVDDLDEICRDDRRRIKPFIEKMVIEQTKKLKIKNLKLNGK